MKIIAISVFDFMTLNIALRVALGSGIIFTKFELIRAWIVAFFDADTLSRCDLDLWLLDLEHCVQNYKLKAVKKEMIRKRAKVPKKTFSIGADCFSEAQNTNKQELN